jgi:hypothetical protein
LTQTIIHGEPIFINGDIFFPILVWCGKYFTLASSNVYIVVFIYDRFFTDFALDCAGLALFEVKRKLLIWDIKLTVGAVLRLHIAFLNMFILFFFLEGFCTKFTCSCIVKLLLMFLQEIFIIHLRANLTFYDISSTISEVRS